MIFKSFSLKAGSEPRRDRSDAGIIVFLMMALVFVPILAAHAAMAYSSLAPQQLAAIVSSVLPAF